jgi:lipopolysaccharide/colanic/teichoic acid biosynthesis glycosyltransferase
MGSSGWKRLISKGMGWGPMGKRPDNKQPSSKAEGRFRSGEGERPLDLHPESSDIPYPRTGGGPGTRLLGEISRRITNVFLALAALLLLLPLMIIVAILIKLDSAGPVIFRQRRVGLDRRSNEEDSEVGGRRVADLGGRPFTIFKFRTMQVGAELESGPVWARKNDPRVTRVGRVLRATRIDEIPQFLNVLKGDMAIVGPRPERPQFVQRLREQIDGYRQRQRVRPGITGWAQVNRGYDQSLEDVRSKVQYDLEYVRRRSLRLDLKIMFLTIPVVLNPSRVYESRRGSADGRRGRESMISGSPAASRVSES